MVLYVAPSNDVYHTTRTINRLYTLDNFEIKHTESNKLLHSFHSQSHPHITDQHQHDSNTQLHGLIQLHPKYITLSFQALGEDVSVDLQLQEHLFEPHSKSLVYMGDDRYDEVPHVLQSYVWYGDNEWFTATLRDDSTFHAVWHQGDDIVQIDPIDAHKQDMHPHHYQSLSTQAKHKMTIFRHSDMENNDFSQCGAVDVTSGLVHAEPKHGLIHEHVSASNTARQLKQLTLWANCYSTQSTGLVMKVGVATDYTFYNMYNSVGTVQATISSIYSNMNTIYITTFNVQFQIGQTQIMSTSGGASWNAQNYNQANTIETMLNALSAWRGGISNTYGDWHLMTNAYPPPGVVGIAWIGSLCNSYYGCGTSSYDGSTYWITVAHETGHNFGALHTFEDGIGTTGSIMDYCDGRLPCYTGTVEFYQLYNSGDFCPVIQKNLNTANCFYPPTNGNLNYASASTAASSPTYTYSYVTGSWSGCSATCNGGSQTRSVQCIQSGTGASVAYSQCGNQAVPASSQSCNTAACSSTWVYSGYGACSASCGGGTQTRSYQCQQNINNAWTLVSNSVCQDNNGAVGVTSQSCNTQACAAAAPNPYIQYSPWGSCTATCGGGIQTRTAACVDANTNAQIASSYCSGYVTQQACGTTACATPAPSGAQPYVWRTGSYSVCSASCGGGVITRSVTCADTNGNTVANSNCAYYSAAPTSTANCNTQACITGTFVWGATSWSTCSASCAGGTSTRTVLCIDYTEYLQGIYSFYGDAYCLGSGEKPLSTQSCNSQACGTVNQYSFSVSAWAACSASCGPGTSTRQVVCQSSSGAQVDISYCGGSSVAPPSFQSCNLGACPATGAFEVADDWSACSAVCGGGTYQRNTTCTDIATGKPTDPSACTSTLPTSHPCGNFTCATYWHTSPWTQCTASCGISASQTRNVTCQYVNDTSFTPTILPDSACYGVRPSTLGQCNAVPCPQWTPSQWSPCDSVCGDGYQTRNITCTNYDNSTTSDSFCNNVAKPSTQQVCQSGACGSYSVSEWSDCSNECGAGTRTRTATCRLPLSSATPGAAVSNDYCASLTPVITSQLCNIDPCTPYYWHLSSKSSCTAACGGGTQSGTFICVESATGNKVADSKCPTSAPSITYTCNIEPCSAYTYQASQWSACSSYCGNGTQTRAVNCVNTQFTNGPNSTISPPVTVVVDSSHCTSLGITPLPSQQSCVAGGSCAGTDTFSPAGICTSAGTCQCRYGQTGIDCTINAELFNVTADTALYTDGIPIGENVQVTWNNSFMSAEFPYVSILLTQPANPQWPAAQYLAQGVVNSGQFVWKVGSLLTDLESGTGYHIRIWFSETTYADSNTLTIANPCDTTSCGAHGICNDGVCVCTAGWSGPSCGAPIQSAADIRNLTLTTVLECNNHGTPAGDICTCPAGYFGVRCECRYYDVKFRISNIPDLNSWFNDSVALKRFERTISNDISVAMGTVSTQSVDINVLDVQQDSSTSMIVDVQFASHCPSISNYQLHVVRAQQFADENYESKRIAQIQTLTQSSFSQLYQINVRNSYKNNPFTPYTQLDEVDRDSMSGNRKLLQALAPQQLTGQAVQLVNVWDSFHILASNSDSLLYHGVTTHNIDIKYGYTVSDPTGLDHPSPINTITNPYTTTPINAANPVQSAPENTGTTSGLPTGVIIGIAVGAGIGALLLLSGAGYGINQLYKKRNLSQLNESSPTVSSVGQSYQPMPSASPEPLNTSDDMIGSGHNRLASVTQLPAELSVQTTPQHHRRHSTMPFNLSPNRMAGLESVNEQNVKPEMGPAQDDDDQSESHLGTPRRRAGAGAGVTPRSKPATVDIPPSTQQQ